jgi:hypothetical protein
MLFSEFVGIRRGAHDVVITPTFHTLEGEAYTGNDITLKPNEIRFVDTKSLIPKKERNRHKWGGMAFSYVGGFMEAWAQLTLHGIRGGGSVNVLFTVLSQKRSNTAEAVWWTPRGGSAVIALGNSSDQPVRANLTFAKWLMILLFCFVPTEIISQPSISSGAFPRSIHSTSGVRKSATSVAGPPPQWFMPGMINNRTKSSTSPWPSLISRLYQLIVSLTEKTGSLAPR